MQKVNFSKIVEEIVKADPRYETRAYEFVREGLDHTLKTLHRSASSCTSNHVSGGELLEGLREYTIKEFGPMGKTILNEWGIHCCTDFGNIVFNLVNQGVLGRNDSDKIEDFAEKWTFDEAFEKPFTPAAKAGAEEEASSSKAATSLRRVKASKPSPKNISNPNPE